MISLKIRIPQKKEKKKQRLVVKNINQVILKTYHWKKWKRNPEKPRELL